eukprot:scaffold326704_cov83-Cyclotella_meneghiniana.AAC.1
MRAKPRPGTIIWISMLFATQVKPGRTASLPVISPGVSNFEACLNATIEADTNNDGIIQKHEYPDFLTSLGDDIIDHRNYDALPIAAKLNFMYLSCWCDKNIACCKGKEKGIIVNGAGLERVCAYTQMTMAYVSQGGETVIPTPSVVETNIPSFRPLKPLESGPSYSPTSFIQTGTSTAVDPSPSAATDFSAPPSASTTIHSPSFDNAGSTSTNTSPFGPSGSPSVVTWDEKFSAIVPTSKGSTGQSNEPQKSLPPAAIIGVTAAVAIVIAAWVAGLFASREDCIDEKVDKKSDDLELGCADPKRMTNGTETKHAKSEEL